MRFIDAEHVDRHALLSAWFVQMKYNPKRNERMAGLPGIADCIRITKKRCKGVAVLFEMQEFCGDGGLDAVSLQPAAGAHAS